MPLSAQGKELSLINPFTGESEDIQGNIRTPLFKFDFESVKINQVKSLSVAQTERDTKDLRGLKFYEGDHKAKHLFPVFLLFPLSSCLTLTLSIKA